MILNKIFKEKTWERVTASDTKLSEWDVTILIAGAR